MSNSVSTRVWRGSGHTKTKLLLLVKIADNVNNDAVGFAGRKYLAKNTRISVRQVQRLIDQIQETGELYVRPGNGRGNETLSLITIGLNHEGIKRRLIDYFEMSPFDAENVSLSIMQKGDIFKQKRETKSTKKGDIDERKSGTTVLTSNTINRNTKTLAVEVQPPDDPIPQSSLPQSHDAETPMLKEVFKETPPVSGEPPSLPDGYEWRCQDGTNHIVKLRKNAHHKGLCGAYAWAGNRGRGIFDCPECGAKLAQLNKPKQLPQYGDLVVIVHKFGFNGADSNAAWGRAGDATKALLADDPTVTPEEFQSFADYWIVLPGKPNFPCGADSLPANFAKWKAGLINGQTTGTTGASARTVTSSAAGASTSITGEGSAGNGQIPKFAPADGTGRKPWERVAKSA